MCLNVFVKALHCVLVARQIMLSLLEAQSGVKEKDKTKTFSEVTVNCRIALGYVAKQNSQYVECQ